MKVLQISVIHNPEFAIYIICLWILSILSSFYGTQYITKFWVDENQLEADYLTADRVSRKIAYGIGIVPLFLSISLFNITAEDNSSLVELVLATIGIYLTIRATTRYSMKKIRT